MSRSSASASIIRIISSVGIGSLKPPERRSMKSAIDSLASLVKLFRLEVQTLDRASERIAKQLHFRLPVGFTPSALRNAR